MSGALLVIDAQNDFLHPDGAYGRAGQTSPALRALPAKFGDLAAWANRAGLPVIASRFTLWPDHPGRGGGPMIAEHLHRARPFLAHGDFAEGSWGHACIDELGVPDACIDKIAYSAFAHTRLGWMLDRWGVTQLFVAGIVTNGGVASTVRDAHVRDLTVTVVSDCCAAFDPVVHEATLVSLGSVVTVRALDELVTEPNRDPNLDAYGENRR
jgi:ureidoacrylate peracid hydrolase